MSDIFDADAADLAVTGGCLCSEVSFRVRGKLRPVVACHCQQCRRSSGHYAAATAAAKDDVEVEGDVTWYRSSDRAHRGFCAFCGSNLFWDDGSDRLAIFAGSLDGPTGLRMDRHIHCASKGDYYALADELPHFEAEDG